MSKVSTYNTSDKYSRYKNKFICEDHLCYEILDRLYKESFFERLENYTSTIPTKIPVDQVIGEVNIAFFILES